MMPFCNTVPPPLVILGASTRAAAFSALGGGLAPICGDLFADADLAARCPVTAVDNYPAGLAAVADAATAGPWMYTGGLENHPDVVRRIAAGRRLYGNDADVLARVRDPFAVYQALTEAQWAAPEVRSTAESLPRDGSWLVKSRRSCGGSGVAAWNGAGADGARRSQHYFQRRIAGTPGAAIYLAAGRDARLLGATEQIMTGRPGRAGAFRYAGSIGPLPLADRQLDLLAAIGRTLAAAFSLRGLFGVDFIDDGTNVWPIEVNPRYTASIEILERACSFSAVGWHVTSCRDGVIPDEALGGDGLWHAKRILYAPCDATIGAAFTHDALAAGGDETKPAVADIPPAGSLVKANRPAMTVFASGASRAEALAGLDDSAQLWAGRLIEAGAVRNAPG